jgi:hypothetical protein
MSDDDQKTNEQRRREILVEVRELVLEAIEQAIARLRAEEIVRLWASVTAAHEAIVSIREEQRAQAVGSEPTAKLH